MVWGKNKEKTFQTYELELTKPEGEDRARHVSESASHSLGLTQRRRCPWQEDAPGQPRRNCKLHIEQIERRGRRKGEMLIEVVGLGVWLGSHCHPAIVVPS